MLTIYLTTQARLKGLEATVTQLQAWADSSQETGNNIPLENICHLLAEEQEIGQVPNDQTLQDIGRPATAIQRAMAIYLTECDEAAACVMYRSASGIICSLLRADFKLFHDRGESVPLWSDLTKLQKKDLIKNFELHASFRNIYPNRFLKLLLNNI
ncbi:hypothetical protein J3Q64DRAFT_1701039 [Phycomyces blakesleeanus]|uniref:Uncharacterized protein n=2 Tax=Phycomyces blakesleeanus TaxID=4837 RepID=A0A162TD43_PHYB8|nr:hypothetical protein PHYBLDRAFT_70990 [Phycomyces blakesleeanus NRRL 1555(-)]OAD66173.1 hypothetical protein PHYBLDRAFT_70990 [Phycomyces blakesleeanus NRRL 1555(-)]|eukprot:XP_018284213.1 hypothetical protein PHYBLDRAFT_70990 [Phycomyces blakesleeanus NRRL 1555(-)]